MSFLREALAAALESAENELPEGVEPEENLSEALMETEDAAQEAEEAEEVVEELEDAADSMEAIVCPLESHVADGGMTTQTALSHNVAMENVLRKLPLDASRFTVSSESFGGTQERLVASQEALEGAKNLLQKLWDGLRNAVSNMWNKLKTFVATFGKSGKAIKAAGADLQVRAGKLDGAPKKAKIDAGGAAKALHTGGSFNGKASSALTAIVKGGEGVVKAAQVTEVKLRGLAQQMASGRYDTQEGIKFAEAITKDLPSGELPGGKEIDIAESGIPKLGSKTNFSGTSTEVSTPSIDEIKATGKAISDVGEFLSTYSTKYFATLEKSVSTFIEAQKTLVSKAGSPEEVEKAKVALKDASKFASIAKSVGPAYIGYAAAAAKAAYAYGKKAAAAYA